MTGRAEQIAAQETARKAADEAIPAPDAAWPDKRNRLIFEAQMLRWHAEQLEARYPATIWPTSGSVAGDERTMHAAQAAFVAGIRFAASQLHDAVSELNDRIYELDPAAPGEPA